MRVTSLFLVLIAYGSTVGAEGTAARPGTLREVFEEFNRRIHAELRAVDPEAERVFASADAARDQGDHKAAAAMYAEVFKRAPTFVAALRRQAGEESALGNRAQAIALQLQAVQALRSADNLAAFARLLATPPNLASNDDMKNAQKLAAEAVALEPENPYPFLVRAEVSAMTSDIVALTASTNALARLVPADPSPYYFRTVALASSGRFDDALASLEEARRLGLPDDMYRQLQTAIANAQPVWPRVVRWGVLTAVLWVASGVLLLVAGMTLSVMTLRQFGHVPADPNAGATSFESGLRRVYRIVIGGCCVYYYFSLPILFALVLLVGGGLIYEMLTVGHMPIKLIFLVFAATIVTGWSILSSLVIRRKAGDPGERLDLEREPELRRALVEVAGNVGTRPVDTVFLTPGTEVAVFERGGLFRQLAGKSERCLILGAGVLDGMSLRPFKAVLAHEYGHFSNRDTAGGGLALSVRMSTVALAVNLAKNGAANWYNPAWLFVNGFHRMFLRISQGASRLQEVLADRWAAILFGATAFEEGLRHVIDRSVRFHAHVNATIKEVVEAKQPLANLYQYRPAASDDPKKLDDAVRTQIEREPSPYDSHPRPADRFLWVHALRTPTSRSIDDAAPVWSLFRERDAIEQRMTSVIRDAVSENHGIRIAAQ